MICEICDPNFVGTFSAVSKPMCCRLKSVGMMDLHSCVGKLFTRSIGFTSFCSSPIGKFQQMLENLFFACVNTIFVAVFADSDDVFLIFTDVNWCFRKCRITLQFLVILPILPVKSDFSDYENVK